MKFWMFSAEGEAGIDIVPVFISVDPERDTVEQVRGDVKGVLFKTLIKRLRHKIQQNNSLFSIIPSHRVACESLFLFFCMMRQFFCQIQ